jgi:hypothetical protein
MANVNNPYGLKPFARTHSGGNPQTEIWPKAAAYGYAIYKWDPVTVLAGVLNGPASGITPGSTRLLGVSLNWSVLSVLTSHQIITDPAALFECQGDGTGGTNMVAAKMGYNANLNVATVAGGGSTVPRDQSGVQVVETLVVTSTYDLRVLSLVNDPTNAYGANARVVVQINKHLRNPEVTVT